MRDLLVATAAWVGATCGAPIVAAAQTTEAPAVVEPEAPAADAPPDGDDAAAATEPPTGAAEPAMDSIEGLSLEALLELEIRVSAASLFDESVLDAASTVDLVTREDWERRGARRTLDAIGNQPSMATYASLWGGTAVAIRGYGSASSVRGVSILLDDVPLNDLVFASASNFSSNVELPTLSRVEIVRGPGSAIHGTDAFHGVLAYRTERPTVDRRVVGGEIGSDLFHRGYLVTSHGVGDGVRVDASLAYSGLPDQDRPYGYTDPSTLTEGRSTRAASFRSLHGTASLRYAPPSSRVDASATFHANVARSVGAPGYGRTFNGESSLTNRDASGSDTELYLGRAEVGVELPHSLRLSALGYFWYGDVFTRSPTIVPTLAGPIASDSDVSFAQARGGVRVTLRQPTNDLHTRWLVGVENSRLRLYPGGFQEITDPRSGVPFRSATFVGESFARDIASLFLTAETRVANGVVRIHYGGRVDHYSDFGFQVTPRVGVVVAPTDRLALKALYGRAFRAPSVFETRGDGTDIGANDAIRPEEIDTFELVVVRESEHLRAQATAFASLWQQAIILVPFADPAVTSRYENAGRNRSFGAEASITYARGPLRVESSASYVRSRNLSVGVDYSAFPSVIANLGVGVDVSPARLSFFAFQRLTAGSTVGDPVSNAAFRDQPTLPVYYRVDLQARWEAIADRLSLTLTVRNLFDRHNATSSLTNAQYGQPGMPINASLALTAWL